MKKSDFPSRVRAARGALLVLAMGLVPGTPALAQQPDTTAAGTVDIPDDELRDSHLVLAGVDLVEDDFPGSWPMFGTTTRMKIGVGVRANFLYDLDGSLDRRQFLMSTIPVDGTPEAGRNGYLSVFASESRFNIDVRRFEEGRPPLQLFIEGDFWPDGSSFRLRQAYMVVGDFIIGQTWTTLSVMESLVTMYDFAGGDALFGGRTTQIRYQSRLSDQWRLGVGLENLSFMGIENALDQSGEESRLLPVLAARLDYHWSTGLLALGSSVGQLRWDGGLDGPDATALRWDAVVGGRQYLGEDYFTWNLSYGHGAGENIMAFAGSEANAVLTAEGDLETIPAFAFVAGYVHKWADQWVSNLSYAYGWLDAPESRAPRALKRGGIGHVNLAWRPVPQLTAALEYMYGQQRTTGDGFGDARRIQLHIQLEF
ncbi:MAG TPA: DcaP family trimeric outer membrane transporter [Longimicrobiales bacterium]|nr:DcaP family trimeric outer membrane transporter [Longimicrobiales bacterium]